MYSGEGVSTGGGAGFRGKFRGGGGGGFVSRGRGFGGDRGGRGFGDRGGRGFSGGRGGFVDRGGRGSFGGGRGFGGDRGGRGFGGGGGGFVSRGRGFGGDRGGRGGFDRGGRGGFSRGGGYSDPRPPANSKTNFSDSDDEIDESYKTQPRRGGKTFEHPASAYNAPMEIQTVVREDGTEVPAKLNNKVFIDGLPYDEPATGASIQDQLAHFASEWKVGKVMALLKKPGQGFGYLAFRSPQSVEVAVKVLNNRKFLGRQLRIEVPKPPREKPNTGFQRADPTNTPYDRQVLLSDLAKIAEPEVIREVIREYAPTLEPKVETIKMAGAGRKAFVTLASAEDVEPFVSFMHGFKLLGRSVYAEAAKAPGSLPFSKPTGPRAFTSPQGVADAFAGRPEASASSAPMSAIDRALAGIDGSSAAAAAPKKAAAAAAPAAKAVVTGSRPSKIDYADQGSKEIIVGNVTDDTTVSDLKSHFASCGRVLDASLVVNPHTREPTGLARVKFAIPAYAKNARDTMNGSRLHGAALRVDREGDDDAEDEEDDDNFVIAGPSGIAPASHYATKPSAAAAAPAPPARGGKRGAPAAASDEVEEAVGKAGRKSHRRELVNDAPEAEGEDDEDAAVENLANQYGVSKAEVAKMMADSKTDTPAPRKKGELRKGDADPSKKRMTTKEMIVAAGEKQLRGKAAEPVAAPVADVVSFEDEDDDNTAKRRTAKKGVIMSSKMKAAAAPDLEMDSDEEVFRDVDVRQQSGAGNAAGKKKKAASKKK
jgi:RNA recognition motif-containing protein